MAMGNRRQSIEVFRLRLRETMNEGDDSAQPTPSSLSEEVQELSVLLPRQEHAPPSSRRMMYPIEEVTTTEETREQQQRQDEAVRTTERTVVRRPVCLDVSIDDEEDSEEVPGQDLLIRGCADSQEEEDIDGRDRPPARRKPPFLSASCSSGDESSSKTLRCSLDAVNCPSLAVDAGEVRAIEAVAQLDERLDSLETEAVGMEIEAESAETTAVQEMSRSKSSPTAQSKDSLRESRCVVLVTRPSQRYVQHRRICSSI